MLNGIVRDTCKCLESLTLLTCSIELFEIELFDHLTLFKQLTDI